MQTRQSLFKVFFVGLFLSVFTAAPLFAVPKTFAPIFKSEKEKVVHIGTSAIVERSTRFRDPFFDQFFGHVPKKQRQSALGSGFIISKDGYIVTNHHVIANADKIEVTLFNDKKFKAKVIGSDKKTDLALIKIDAKDLPYAEFGNSSKLEIGDWVVALGNPLGLDHTLTAGILSARSRDIFEGKAYGQFLQTDAAINQGNSGGPLYNMNGKVIGINTAIVAGAQGLGFAIPSNLAEHVIKQLKEHGKVKRGWLGVHIQTVNNELAESFGLPKWTKGVALAQIGEDTPAEKSGLKQGDVIVEYDGKPMKKGTELQRAVAETTAGKTVKVKLYRQGELITKDVKIGQRPSSDFASLDAPENKFGMQLAELTPESKSSLNLRQNYGLVVYDLDQTGVAWEKGLRRGDVIVEANQKKMKTISDFNEVVAQSKKRNRPISLLVIRRGYPIFMALPVE